MIPKVTNPPFVLKSSNGSPLNSGGGIGAQQHGGTLAHFFELPTSVSSYHMVIKPYKEQKKDLISVLYVGFLIEKSHRQYKPAKTLLQ